MMKREVVIGLNCQAEKPDKCSDCMIGKSTKRPFLNLRSTKETQTLALVHCDLMGPFNIESWGGSRFVLTIIDDASRYTRVYFLKRKGDTLEKFKEWMKEAENQTRFSLKRIRTDNELEFCSSPWDIFTKAHSIVHERTMVYTPEQNGVAERMNRTLLNLVRSTVNSCNLPTASWAELTNTAAYLRNRVTNRHNEEKTPFELWFGKRHALQHLGAIGCETFVHVPKQRRNSKLQPRATKGILVGYSLQGREASFQKESNADQPVDRETEELIGTTGGIDQLSETLPENLRSHPMTLRSHGKTAESPEEDNSGGQINATSAEDNNPTYEEAMNSPEDAKGVSTPMETNLDLSVRKNGNSNERFPYRELNGGLSYLSQRTRPDIAYAVGTLSRYCDNYTRKHWEAGKRVLRYLKSTKDFGITKRSTGKPLIAFSDASWASDIVDRKGVSGHLIILAGAPLIWRSTKQTVTALSTMESEYIALSSAVKDITWVRNLMEQLKLSSLICGETKVFCDNQAAISHAENYIDKSKTRHFAVKYHFVREKISEEAIKLFYTPSAENPADFLTKPLARSQHEKYCRALMDYRNKRPGFTRRARRENNNVISEEKQSDNNTDTDTYFFIQEDEQLDNHVLSDVDIEEPVPDIMINRKTESSGSDRPQRTRTIPKRFDDYVLATTNETIPKDYEEAIACEDKKHWENAMLEEIQNIYSHQVWELVPRPVNAEVVKSKWVFKISKDQENKTYKARLIAMGYNQIPGREYNESFSPVIEIATLRTILSMAATKDSVIKLFDVKTAYLNGNIENTIFMEQPAGFVQDRNKVCKLNKSIYGLPQSGRS
ncbi:hypothetical protein LAZ67_19001583 [Cordylochernes scorpioides]|uniref:Integrase catalytic domain-containing protein n=1 Tax=Cordylochernes scorpioides TaxID=51811 RepID=A0ABY6LHU2_9ARAC|nr:hypothetical protein LAZ67_19001583 [Cordylochernes scorpioides]